MRAAILTVLAAALAASAPAPGGDVEKLLPDAEAVKKSARKLSKESIAKIEGILGGKLDAGSFVIYEAKATVQILSAFEKSKVFVTFVDAKGPKGTVRLGVAVVPADKIVAKVGVLKNTDDPAVESPRFLGQFEGYEYTDSLSQTAKALEDVRRKASGSDAEAKEISILLRTNEEMRKLTRHWHEALDRIERGDRGAAAELDGVESQAKLIVEFTKKIPFLSDAQQKRFDGWMADMRKGLPGVKSEINAGKFDPAKKAYFELEKVSCSRCHASNQRAFKEQRAKHGIGNGWFEPGLDVSTPDPAKDEAFHAILKEIRKAVLVLAEAR